MDNPMGLSMKKTYQEVFDEVLDSYEEFKIRKNEYLNREKYNYMDDLIKTGHYRDAYHRYCAAMYEAMKYLMQEQYETVSLMGDLKITYNE